MRFRDALRGRPPRPKPGDVVLGQELARAIEVDKRHTAATPSPLDGVGYEPASGAYDMHRFVESSVDASIEAFVAEVRAKDPDEIQAARAALRMDDLYTLLAFVRRCALACVSGRDAPQVGAGVCALLLIEQDRVDWRDLADAAELLAWAMAYTGMDHRAEILGAARAMGTALEPSVESTTARAGDALEPSRRMIETPAGRAFADTYFERYEPTLDLVALAFAVQGVLERDVYRVTHLTVEAGLPEVWLSTKGQTVADALSRVIAGVSLSGALDPAVCKTADDQQLSVFLVEAAGDQDAAVLAAAAVPTKSYEALGIAVGRVCCVVVARSIMAGVRSYEKRGALTRFDEPLHTALTS